MKNGKWKKLNKVALSFVLAVLFSLEVTETAIAADEERLKQVTCYSSDGIELYTTIYEYDDRDRLIGETTQSRDPCYIEYAYDEDNRLIKAVEYQINDNSAELTSTTLYEYGDNGLLEKVTTHNSSQTLTVYKEYYPDGRPKVILDQHHYYNMWHGGIYESHYDSYGHLAEVNPYYYWTKFTEISGGGFGYGYIDDLDFCEPIRTYDEEGRVINAEYCMRESKESPEQIRANYHLTYDQAGRIAISVFRCDLVREMFEDTWRYRYNDDGSYVCQFTEYVDQREKPEIVSFLEFDTKGNLVGVLRTVNHGEPCSVYEWAKYNEQGDVISFRWIDEEIDYYWNVDSDGISGVIGDDSYFYDIYDNYFFDYKYDEDGRLVSKRGTTINIEYEYDDKGNILMSKNNIFSGETYQYEYTYENGAVRANGPKDAYKGLKEPHIPATIDLFFD